jgi:type IV pilus assembly protein PilC
MIVTPGQLARRADFYFQLSRLTASGFGLIRALEIELESPPSRAFRPVLGQLLHHLKNGQPLAQAVQSLPRGFPEFEVAILNAAEQSGRLPECFQLLGSHYQERAALARQFLGLVAYPVLLFHLAVLIFPTTQLQALVLKGHAALFCVQKVLVLAPVYAVVLLAIYLSQANRNHAWRALLEAVLQAVPLLGLARRDLALARLSAALEALLNAGVPIVQAWEVAAPASGSPALIRAVRDFQPHLEAHATPAEAVQRSQIFPHVFASYYSSAELSGKLDETLRWLRSYYQEEGTRELRRVIVTTGGLVFLLVAALVAWQVVSFYVGYFRQIQEVIPP